MNKSCKPLILLALLAASGHAPAAVTSSLSAGTLTVSSDAGDAITITCASGNVLVNGGNPDTGAATCASVLQLVVNGDNQPNTIDLSGVDPSGFPQLGSSTITAQAGNDSITGSAFADQINAGLGDDTIVAGAGDDSVTGGDGVDVAELGDGNDVFIWNPGDDNDVVEGDDGNDVLQFNGANVAEIYNVLPNGTRVQLTRNVASVTMDLGTVEQISLALLGGADSVTVADISDTTLSVVRADLAAAGGAADGVADSLTVDGSNDADDYTSEFITGGVALSNGGRTLQVVNADPELDTITVNALGGNDALEIRGSAGNDNFLVVNNGGAIGITAPAVAALLPLAVEALTINGLDGDDTINASALPEAFAALTLLGGNGNDTLTGGDGADLLDGGPGNDLLDGDDNPVGTTDTVRGGEGDDTMVWNPGKDDDLNIGGPGNDVTLIVGGGAAETFAVTVSPLDQTVVRLARTAPAPFFVDISETEILRVQGNDGDDVMTAATLPAGLISLELLGGAGNDTLTGSDGADLLDGGPGNDLLDGDDNPVGTVDTVQGGEGDDTMVWNPGKDDDLNLGGPGNDTTLIVGGGAAETFAITLSPLDATRVRLARTTPAPFFVDIGETEILRVEGNDGDDVMNAATLPAGLITLELLGGGGNDSLTGSDGVDLLDGGAGNDVLDGDDNPVGTVDTVRGGDGDDTLVWNPGKDDDLVIGGAGDDRVIINGGGGDEQFRIIPETGGLRFERTNNAPAPFFVQIRESERLQVNAGAGNDRIDASALTAGLITLELNGEAGNDILVGGPDADVLNGGDGNDTLQGGPNPLATVDRMDGGAGDDLLLWNPGEASDLNEGGDGNDTLLVNGAGADERFEIEERSGRIVLQRVLPSSFVLDNGGVEIVQLNTAGGDDVVQTALLAGATQQLDGGAAATAAGDRLLVRGYGGRTDVSPILAPGAGAISHNNFESSGAELGGGSFSAVLDGAQEVPPVATAASGRGRVLLNASEDEITVTLSFTGLGSSSTMAHIHGPALPGSNAPAIFTLAGAGGSAGDIGPLRFAVTPTQVQQLKDGLWYFNVHSVDQPAGEIRGQLLIDEVFTATLEGRQVVPQSLSTASGYATLVLAGSADQATLTLSYAGLVGEGVPGVSTAVRVHAQGPRGLVGPVVTSFVLPVSGTDRDSFVAGPFPMSAGQVNGLRSSGWYVEVESLEFPQGEIRGQFSKALFFDSFE